LGNESKNSLTNTSSLNLFQDLNEFNVAPIERAFLAMDGDVTVEKEPQPP
jgi:hypothetical protein